MLQHTRYLHSSTQHSAVHLDFLCVAFIKSNLWPLGPLLEGVGILAVTAGNVSTCDNPPAPPARTHTHARTRMHAHTRMHARKHLHMALRLAQHRPLSLTLCCQFNVQVLHCTLVRHHVHQWHMPHRLGLRQWYEGGRIQGAREGLAGCPSEHRRTVCAQTTCGACGVVKCGQHFWGSRRRTLPPFPKSVVTFKVL